MSKKEQIRALRAQGMKYDEIALELECSKSVISYHLNPAVKESTRRATEAGRKRRYAKINKIKESKPCADCGKFFEGYLMDFDHLPEFIKSGNIGNMVKRDSWAKIEAELAKCEVVCCMCHRVRTKDRWLQKPLST